MKNKIIKNMISLMFLLIFAPLSFAQSANFLKGEELFRQNKPKEAIPFLNEAVREKNNPQAFIYLALSYYQLREYDKALAVCNEGMNLPETNQKILAYNAGNIAFSQGDYDEAEKWYSIAIAADEKYASPVLNRANARLRAGKYGESKADYILYMELYPENPQKEQITKIIGLIDDEIVIQQQQAVNAEQLLQAENARIQAENARIEAARLAEEKRLADEKAAEEARKAKLLEDVASSLNGSSTENMSAGAEGTVGYGYESELE